IDHPLQVADTADELTLDRRQSNVHDRRVDDHHQVAQANRQQWEVSAHGFEYSPETLRLRSKHAGATVLAMDGDADIAAIGALVADPARARILLALGDGRALPASVLAEEAGVATSTASAHLSRLLEGGFLDVEQHGRHRYYRVSRAEVAELL